eukprot:6180254-Pleurochrysis_carterae.AAC.1
MVQQDAVCFLSTLALDVCTGSARRTWLSLGPCGGLIRLRTLLLGERPARCAVRLGGGRRRSGAARVLSAD